MERHVEGVVERGVLGVEEIEATLDALLDHRPRERLVDVEAVAVRAERARALAPHVDRERGHRVQEERLDVVARDDRDRVRPEVLEPLLDPAHRGVHPQHQVAVLGLRADQELRGVRDREGADEHVSATLAQEGLDGRAGGSVCLGAADVVPTLRPPRRSSAWQPEPGSSRSSFRSRRAESPTTWPIRPTRSSARRSIRSAPRSSRCRPRPRRSSSRRPRTPTRSSRATAVSPRPSSRACETAKSSGSAAWARTRWTWTRLPRRASWSPKCPTSSSTRWPTTPWPCSSPPTAASG